MPDRTSSIVLVDWLTIHVGLLLPVVILTSLAILSDASGYEAIMPVLLALSLIGIYAQQPMFRLLELRDDVLLLHKISVTKQTCREIPVGTIKAITLDRGFMFSRFLNLDNGEQFDYPDARLGYRVGQKRLDEIERFAKAAGIPFINRLDESNRATPKD